MVKTFLYQSGEEIECGDHVLYHGEQGQIELVAAEKVWNDAIDWYIEKYPGGGIMLDADNFGHVFLTEEDIDEKLEFVSRARGYSRTAECSISSWGRASH